MFSGVRWTLFTDWSRQMAFATGCASGWWSSSRCRRSWRGHRRDVALDQVVDLVEPDQLADVLVREVDLRVDEHLLRELDDRAVRAADVLAAPPCVRSPETIWMMRSTWYGSSG